MEKLPIKKDEIEKIDEKDEKILVALSENSRFSSSSLAKLTGLSREVVDYRIKRLKDKKIILKFAISTRLPILRYERQYIELKFRNSTPEEEEAFINLIIKKSNIFWAAKTTGDRDYVIEISARGPTSFSKKLNMILELIGDKIADYKTYREFGYEHRGYSFFNKNFNPNYKRIIYDKKSFNAEFYKPKIEVQDIDERDKRILDMISENSRIKLSEVSKKTDIDIKTVKKRIIRLIRGGIIGRFTLIINPNTLGYAWYRIFMRFKNISEKRLSSLKEYLRMNKNVTWTTEILGDYNLSFSIMTKDYYEFDSFVRDLRTRFKDIILNYRIVYTLKRYKYNPSYLKI